MRQPDAAIVSSGPMAPKEVAELERLEHVIEQGERAFWDTGRALAIIHAKKLYRPKTWKAYLADRFDITDDRAAQLMASASVYDDLKLRQLSAFLPANESQCRPLVPLETAQRREAWGWACQEIGRGHKTPTAAQVSAAVAHLLGVPEGIDDEGGIDADLAEVLEGLPPERQQAIVEVVEARANKRQKVDDDGDAAWLARWKEVRSARKRWDKRSDWPPPVQRADEFIEKAAAELEKADDLWKKRIA